MSERVTGEVVFWTRKGYGFLKPDAERVSDVYCHITSVRPKGVELAIGDKVSFAIGTGRGGKRAAIDVRLCEASAASGAPSVSPVGVADLSFMRR